MTADARRILRVTKDFGDRYVDVEAWRVPESDRYPEGVKYSMQYGTTAGDTIRRYDNFPGHPGTDHHHVHRRDGSVEAVDFEGLASLYQRFKREVNEHGNDW